MDASEVTHLALRDIETDEATFQHRQEGWETTWEGREQIKDLMRHLRTTKEPLDPILVYPHADGKFTVIDGHHRLKAYKEVWWEHLVPVTVFKGALRDAKEAAFAANGKGQRTYSLRERQEKAWAYTKEWFFDGMKELSKEWTAKRVGIAEGTVAKMRRTIKAKGEAVRSLSWAEVMQGPDESQHSPDPDWKEKKAEELRQALIKLNIIHYVKSPDILAMALDRISPSLARSLVDHWGHIAIEVAQDLEWHREEEDRAVEAGLLPGI